MRKSWLSALTALLALALLLLGSTAWMEEAEAPEAIEGALEEAEPFLLGEDESEAQETVEAPPVPAEMAGSVALTEDYFPDPAFRDYLALYFEVEEGDVLNRSLLEEVTLIAFDFDDDISALLGLTVEFQDQWNETFGPYADQIHSLAGIEHFPNLSILICSNCPHLTDLDLFQNTELMFVDVSSCGLRALNAAGCSSLAFLYCDDNPLRDLDLKGCGTLVYLNCTDNDLETLDISDSPALLSIAFDKYRVADGYALTSSDGFEMAVHCDPGVSLIPVDDYTPLIMSGSMVSEMNAGEQQRIVLDAMPVTSFSSNKTQVATVDGAGILTAHQEGKATISLKSGGKTYKLTLTVVDPNKPTDFDLAAPEGDMDYRQPCQIVTRMLPEGTSAQIEWEVSPSKGVTITDEGLMTVAETGKYTVTARVPVRGGKTVKRKVKLKFVDPTYPTKLVLNQADVKNHDMREDLTLDQWTLEPEGTAEDVVIWTASPKDAVEIKDNVIHPLKEGKVTITGAASKNKKAKATFKMTIVDYEKPTSVVLTPGAKSVTIDLTEVLPISAALEPAGTARGNVIFELNSSKYATLEDGVLKPLREGSVTVKAYVEAYPKVKAKLKVAIKDLKAPKKIEIEQGKSATLGVNQTLTLTTKVTPTGAGYEPRCNLTWSEPKPAGVVSFDPATGQVRALAPGKARITVTTDNKKKASITIKVTE